MSPTPLTFNTGEAIRNIYFPTGCHLLITATMNDGSTAEVGLVGFLGANALMGESETTQTEYIVQIAGSAMHIEASILRQEFEASPELRDIMLRYTQALIAQISQTAACNRLQSLEQRFARWLLEAQFRIQSDQLILTHRFIANMLGVHRAGAAWVAQKL